MFQNLQRKRQRRGGLKLKAFTVLGLVLATLVACFAAVSMSPVVAQPVMQLRGAIDFMPVVPVAFGQALSDALTRIHWKTALLVVHIAGLVAGFGAALFLDFLLLQHLYSRAITQSTHDIVAYGQRMVTIGLSLLWISGLGFLVFYYFADPDKLANPKLWAKLTIVCLLTLNGMLIHLQVAPRLAASIGAPLLKGVSLRNAAILLAAGAISCTSWAFAATLGLVKELNNVVSGDLIMLAYFGATLVVMLGAAGLHMVLAGPATRVPRLPRLFREIT